MISVVVADDQAAVRDGLVTILGLAEGIDVVASARDGAEALEAVVTHRPDVLLVDLRMPVMDGVTTVAAVAEKCPSTKILVLTTYSDDASISRALAAGAHGYVTKSDGALKIVAAIHAVAAGHSAFGAEATRYVIGAIRAQHDLDCTVTTYGLTDQESRVLSLIAAGHRNRDIADELVVSITTVKTHINNLFTKLGVKSRTEAVQRIYGHTE